MRLVVNSFFRFLYIFSIIFLTGCAARGYHGTVGMLTGQAAIPSFQWPLEGRVASSYGGREDGITLKGMVLEGAEGQEVRAAEQGEVVYVDDSLRGYGKTVVLEHGGDYSTVYARNSQVLVRVGDPVSKGQSIARIGRDGKGAAPQLYFEVRCNAKPLDPELVLK